MTTTDLGFAWTAMRTSWGMSGTSTGVERMLERERERQPTIWLDAGDLTVGPAAQLLGERPWQDVAGLPLLAAATGNHDFDEGVAPLNEAARRLPFPLLCANADAGLPAHVLLEMPGGPLGVIGLTHPFVHLFADAPEPVPEVGDVVRALARELRVLGARWVIVLLHEGVTWWPAAPIGTRDTQLARMASPWARHADLIVGGHTPAGWTGAIRETPAGHPYAFAATVMVADLPRDGSAPVIRGLFRVPADRPVRPGRAARAVQEAERRVVGRSRHTWLSRTGEGRYLPDLLAAAVVAASGAQSAFVPPGKHATQAPLDGCVAHLPAGPVSELDLIRLFGGYGPPVVAELTPGQFDRLVHAHDALADPRSRTGDALWWNWCRMRAGVERRVDDPRTVALLPSTLPVVRDLLRCELSVEPVGTCAMEACIRLLNRGYNPGS
ncbi:metallophosphoesterase [Nonomuraea fuscirosea]